jgi:hypothetical protein
MLYNRAYKLICNDLATLRTSGRPEEMRDPDTPSQLTIEDVAQLAGVSVSSARNYFSRPQLLSTPTHARLKAAVAQTGYHPRGSLSGLGRRQRGRVGFEVPRGEDPAANPVFNQLLLSLLWSARAAGYRLQPFVTGKEPGSRGLRRVRIRHHPRRRRPRTPSGGRARADRGGRLRRLPAGGTDDPDPHQPAPARRAAGRPGGRPFDRQARQPPL